MPEENLILEIQQLIQGYKPLAQKVANHLFESDYDITSSIDILYTMNCSELFVKDVIFYLSKLQQQ